MILKRSSKLDQDRLDLFILKEVYALAALGMHPHVVRYHTAWVEDEHLYIQTEYCDGGSLQSQFEHGAKFTEEQLCNVMRQVAHGLHHIHSSNLVHLDIKPENIYVTPSGEYKIGDFGLISLADARLFQEGDCRYLPKELLTSDELPPGIQLPQADIFSLGCSIYELATRRPNPKSGEEWQQIREGQINLPPTFSQSFEQLLRRMLDPEPDKRPTSSQLLNDPLLRSKEQSDYINLKAKTKRLKVALTEKQIRIGQLETMLEFYVKDLKEREDARDRQLKEDRERLIRIETLMQMQKASGNYHL